MTVISIEEFETLMKSDQWVHTDEVIIHEETIRMIPSGDVHVEVDHSVGIEVSNDNGVFWTPDDLKPHIPLEFRDINYDNIKEV